MEHTKKPITRWCNPDEKISTQWGYITYRQWCEKEVARINRNGDTTKVIEKNGLIAVSR